MLAALSLGLVALPGGCAAPVRSVVVRSSVEIVIVDASGSAPSPPAIDASDPRLGAASEAIAQSLGHRLTFSVDTALVAGAHSELQALTVRAMEQAASGLSRAQHAAPEAFAQIAPHLQTIALAYSASEREGPWVVDTSGVLSVPVTSEDAQWLVARQVEDAITATYLAWTSSSLSGRRPESMSPAEQSAYFDELQHGSWNGSKEGAHLELDRLTKTVHLHGVVRDPVLSRKVRASLLSAFDLLGRARDRRRDDASAASSAEWTTAQTVYIRWLDAQLDGLNVEEREGLSRRLFRDMSPVPTELLRGFDFVRFARPVFAAFAARQKSGHHDRDRNGPEYQLEYDLVRPLDHHPDGSPQPMANAGDFYGDLLASDRGLPLLAGLIVELENDAIVEAAIHSVFVKPGPATAMKLADELLADNTAGASAVRHLASCRWEPPESEAGVAWVRRAWGAHPNARGPLLWALVEIGAKPEGLVPWGTLPEFLGSAITSAEFASYLEQDSAIFWALPKVARGLSPGWSRTAVIVPRLERWLTDLPRYDDGGGHRMSTAESIVEALCVGGSPGDLAAFQAWLRRRIEDYPAEAGEYGHDLGAVSTLCPRGAGANAEGTRSPAPPPRRPHDEGSKPALFGN